MTREEIIRNLEYTMEKHKNDIVSTFDTNISLMCKDILDYLEQEPCEDCVSREAVLETLRKSWLSNTLAHRIIDNIGDKIWMLPSVTPAIPTCYDLSMGQVVKGIHVLSPVTPKPRWIPVDYDRYPETYPKAFQEVWITDAYGEVRHKAYDGTRSIKAWMPYIIPKPYKAESEG